MRIISRMQMFFILFFKLVNSFAQLLYGSWKISKLANPIISIFGGARITQDSFYFNQAKQIATKLVKLDISIMSGGGPGIMEAASCGAISIQGGKYKSIGIAVSGLDEKANPCLGQYFELTDFFTRKWLLTHYSKAFIFFPGGFGTLDELFEILTLMQTKKMHSAPVILIGKEFWTPFMEWLTQEIIVHGAITKQDAQLVTITDDLDAAIKIVYQSCAVGASNPNN